MSPDSEFSRAEKASATDDQIPGGVWVLAGVAFAVALGFGVVAPAIPLFAVQYGVGKTAVGFAISAFAFFRFISALGAGGLVDRFGERRVLVAGLLTVAITTGTAPLSENYLGFVVMRGIGGIGSAAFTVSATALVLRLAPATKRGRATNRFQSGFLLGGMMGPAIGGPLTDIDARMPFFFYGGTLVIAALVALIGLRGDDRAQRALRTRSPAEGSTKLEKEDSAAGWQELLGMFRHPAYLAAIIINFGTGWTLFGVRNSLIPLYVVEDLHKTATFTGIGLLVGAVAQTLGILRAGWFSDSVGRRPATILGSSLLIASCVVLALPGHVTMFLFAMVLMGFAGSLLGSAPSAVVGDIAPSRSGRVVAAYGMAGDIGAVIGPIAAGAVAQAMGSHVAFGITAVVVVFGLLAALRMPETSKTR